MRVRACVMCCCQAALKLEFYLFQLYHVENDLNAKTVEIQEAQEVTTDDTLHMHASRRIHVIVISVAVHMPCHVMSCHVMRCDAMRCNAM